MPAALPVETTGSIFEFCSNDTLASLSRVNSTFHSTAIRVLYRTVVIVSPFRQAIRLLTTLSSNQTAARAVRAFQVDFPPRFCLSSFYNLLRASLRCAAGIIHLGLEVGGPCGYLLSQSTFEPADVCILGNYDEYMNEFFHRQPQIENLVMYPYGPSREVRPIFPVGAFPLLRTIEAPAAFVAAVCSGCPITYAGVIDSDPDSDDVVDIVSKISCCPERLHIVNICVGNGDQFDTIVAGLTRLPLRVLILNVNEWDQALHDDLDRYANQFHELSVMLLGGHADADGAMPNFELWFRNCPKLMELKFGGYFYRRGQDGGPERVLSLPDEV